MRYNSEIWISGLYLLVIIGAIYLSLFSSLSSIGQSVLVAAIMIPVTYFVTEYVLLRKKKERWNKLSKYVLEKLNDELNGLFTDITNICGFNRVIWGEYSNDDLTKKINEHLVMQLKSYARNKDIQIKDSHKLILLKRGYGNIFKTREDYLNQFQIKYLEYLDAEIIIALNDIQTGLHSIDQKIAIRNKQVENKWLRLDNDEELIKRLNINFQKIINNLQTLKELNIFRVH